MIISECRDPLCTTLFQLCLELKISLQLFLSAAGTYASACQRGKSFLLASHHTRPSIGHSLKSAFLKNVVIQAISCTGTTTLFSFIASVEMMHPNLAHTTRSARDNLTVNEDSTTKQVLAYDT